MVVVGRPEAADTQAMLAAFARPYLPGLVLLCVEPGAHQARVAELLPWVADMRMLDDRATAYVCRAFVCQAPTTDLDVAVTALTGAA